jgi:phosphatidylserine/phosphatidylglycerophosphate/cardiolipin synthase-like enzyme
MEDSLIQLAQVLTPSQATSIAASLEIDGRLDYAVAALPNTAHPAVGLLSQVLQLLGDASVLASVLRGYARAGTKAPDSPRPVWSGPSFNGDGDHTTAAVAHLIDEAREDVFASTYSASTASPFVQALWRAIARGVSVTILLEAEKMVDTSASLQSKLQGARFLTYMPPDGGYGVQHSKVIIIDSAVALVTSANLSEAAAYKNLEAGVLIRDPNFASGMRQKFISLLRSGSLEYI